MTFSALTCSGERCIIIFLALGYWLASLIAYLPYLLINKPIVNSKFEKKLVFFLPTLIFILTFLTYNTDMFDKNIVFLMILILPNFILQIIFLFYYQFKQKNGKDGLKEKIKKWNSL